MRAGGGEACSACAGVCGGGGLPLGCSDQAAGAPGALEQAGAGDEEVLSGLGDLYVGAGGLAAGDWACLGAGEPVSDVGFSVRCEASGARDAIVSES